MYIKPTLFKNRSSHMHCGKAYLDICKVNDKCSFKRCINDHCIMQNNGPNVSEGVGLYIILMFYVTIFIIILLIILIIYKCFIKVIICNKVLI